MRWLTLVLIALQCATVPTALAQKIRVTTWNMEWFPAGSAGTVSAEVEEKRVAAAATHLRSVDSDVLLLQEVRDWETCERLARALLPLKYQVLVCSAFRDSFGGGIGRQQVAILAKTFAQAAWSESWRSKGPLDPPRGFAFAAIRCGSADVGFYSLHLKSNLAIRNVGVTVQKNIAKREVAAEQLLEHIGDVKQRLMPSVKQFIVGGDFNTNKDQALFVSEKTLDTLKAAGLRDVFLNLPLARRITHPGKSRYPDATFDYIFLENAHAAGVPRLMNSEVSDHLSVTCDVTLE